MINWDMFKAIHNNKELAFEQLCYYLFCDEFSQHFGIIRYKNQPALETNPIDVNGEYVGFQAKFFSTTISSHVVELKDCITNAVTRYSPPINRLVFYLSEEFSASTNSNKVKPTYQQHIENHALQYNIKIDWRFRSNIEQQLINPTLEHIRNYYFPESFDCKAEKIITEENGASFLIERFVKLNNTQSKHSLLESLDLNNRII